MKKAAQHQVFLNVFSDIDFKVIHKESKRPVSIEIMQSSEKEIIRALQQAKQDLARAKKSHKQGKLSSEELFDWEWRVHELTEELSRMREEIDDLRDLDGWDEEGFDEQ